jgi:hypothetical protein
MTKKYVMQTYEVFIKEVEVIADSQEEAKKKYDRGEYSITNEYYLDIDNDTWGEVVSEYEKEEIKKKLH